MIRVNFSALVGLEVCSFKLFLPSRHFFVGSIRVKPQDSTSLICRSEYRRSLSHPYTHCTVITTTYGYFLNSNDIYFLKSYKYLLFKVSNLPILTRAYILQILCYCMFPIAYFNSSSAIDWFVCPLAFPEVFANIGEKRRGLGTGNSFIHRLRQHSSRS